MPDLEAERAKWKNRGASRPEFAIEPAAGQESVWDYPRPPRLERDERLVRVVHAGTIVAETQRAYRVLETASPPVFYLPPGDVQTALLVPGEGTSECEWKGSASYWSLGEVENVAWSYPNPYPEFEAIRDYYGFYPARIECYVGERRVEPQAGGFYGGWVTPEIVGPFKGEPGTGGW